MKTKRIGVILAGCGRADGSEIHESTLTLLAISKFGASYKIFAPDRLQHHVINHLTGEEMPEQRNALVESARIARGIISPLADFNANELDALIIPGGFGTAKNLSTYAFDGIAQQVLPELKEAVLAMYQQKKPIGALCIAPVILAGILKNIEVTTGKDHAAAMDIEAMGSKNISTSHGEITVDKTHRIYTTPCYMMEASIFQVYTGIEQLVHQMLTDLDTF